jgi:hypothetical protein
MKDLASQSKTSYIPDVFDALGIGQVSPNDEFSIKYKNGILEARVIRNFGIVESVKKHVKGGFNEMAIFEPQKMDKKERNDLIKSLHASGDTQREIERKFGITQGMISRIVNS